jgi:hypothetical protein
MENEKQWRINREFVIGSERKGGGGGLPKVPDTIRHDMTADLVDTESFRIQIGRFITRELLKFTFTFSSLFFSHE